MTLPRKLMIDGEQTIATTRTHLKVLIVPFLILLVVAGLTGFAMNAWGDELGGNLKWILLALGLILVVAGSGLPWLRWITWTYTLTNKRIVEQKGILTRSGRVIPLSRINDVAFEKNLNDRILGCGTLVIHDASEQSGLRLNDIPKIEAFHRTVSNLVMDAHGTTSAGRDESV